MNKDGEGFQYLKSKFPRISDAKLKKDFHRSTNTRAYKGRSLQNEVEGRAWTAFVNVCHNFLGNKKDENYHDIIQELISAYKALKCNMSLKIHFLDSHLHFFRKILALYQMNMEKGFTKTCYTLKGDTMENTLKECLQILLVDTAGNLLIV
ncbi:hypothetical protein EVAR_73557_1 [Eumeta japonica]|uniref:Uncharacterized protein n=1 Tax=Eumeta variegata TaxID=151549 RepID=A0A4C2AC14_EUMVA|nr:hypothetical protein EVAR_73557_1 [Eumeta japonica]